MKRRNILTALALIAFCSLGAFAQSAKGTGTQAVRDVDQPARQPFYKLMNSTGQVYEAVPEGKVLVIEHVNGRVISSGPGSGELVIFTASPEGDVEMYNIIAPTFYNSSENIMRFTSQIKLYIPAGRTVGFGYSGNAIPSSLYASFSGHYVNVQ